MATHRKRAALVLAALCVLNEGHAAELATPIVAVWREQQVQLTYRSISTRYSCKELASRVTAILFTVGARSDVSVRANCNEFASIQSLRITLRHPVEATAENVLAVTSFDPARRLLAELRGEALPTPADVPTFAAIRRQVRLTKIHSARLGNGDCQLLRTLRDQVFPQLDVRIPRTGFNCSDEASAIRPYVIAEALLPMAG